MSHTLAPVRRSSVVFPEHSVSAAIMHVLFSPFDKRFEKSLGTLDFLIVFVAESLFAFSAALMKFSSSSLQPSRLVDALWLGKIDVSLSGRCSKVSPSPLELVT